MRTRDRYSPLTSTERPGRLAPVTASGVWHRREKASSSLLLHPLDDGFGLGCPSNRFEPSRRLRQSRAQEPHDHRAERSDHEQPSPAIDAERLARHQDSTEETSRRNTHEAERVRPRGVASSQARWKQLAQVGIDQCQFRADADSRQEAKHDQHRRVDAEGAGERKDGVDAEVQQKRRSAAVAIGESSEHHGTDEHANERGAQGRRKPQADRAQMFAVRTVSEEPRPARRCRRDRRMSPIAGDDGRVTMGSRRRQPVQPRGYGSARRCTSSLGAQDTLGRHGGRDEIEQTSARCLTLVCGRDCSGPSVGTVKSRSVPKSDPRDPRSGPSRQRHDAWPRTSIRPTWQHADDAVVFSGRRSPGNLALRDSGGVVIK